MEKWMNKLTIEDLPELYQPLAEALGVMGVISLSEEFGGSYMYIPKIDNLVRVARDSAILKDYKEGKSIRNIVKKYKLSESRIRAIITESNNINQTTIFDFE